MPPEADLAVAIAKIEAISGDMAEVKTTMRELAQAVSRLAVVEERQVATNGAIERAFKELGKTNEELGKLDSRLGALEQAQPIQRQSSDFVQSAVKYIVAAVLGAVIAGVVRVPPAVPAQNPPAITGK